MVLIRTDIILNKTNNNHQVIKAPFVKRGLLLVTVLNNQTIKKGNKTLDIVRPKMKPILYADEP